MEKKCLMEINPDAFKGPDIDFIDDPDNPFGDLASKDLLPVMFPSIVKSKMTPMDMIVIPKNEVKVVMDGGAWSPIMQDIIDTFLASGPWVVRFGGRTPHDSMNVIAKDAESIRLYLREYSERAMLEAWAWCPRFGYLPLTRHTEIKNFVEFRVQTIPSGNGADIKAGSTSMWSDEKLSRQGYMDWWDRLIRTFHPWLTTAYESGAFKEPRWFDIGITNSDWYIFDANPDKGLTWPGWHSERDDSQSGLILRMGDQKIKCDFLDATGKLSGAYGPAA